MRALLLLLFVVITGCGPGGHGTASVKGVVTLNGTPVTSGKVTFFPEGGRSAKGFIQQDGTFVLGTYEEADGAIPGTHKITIADVSSVPSTGPDYDNVAPRRKKESPIPERYANPSASGLTREVKAGEDNYFELELTK